MTDDGLARHVDVGGDLQKLLASFETGELLRPSAETLNLVDLARALALRAGVEGVPLTPGALELARVIGDADHLVFVLADGFGMTFVEALPQHAFLRGHLVAELQTVFPSATAVALTSLATAEWPNQHGVLGWWTLLPEAGVTATVLRFLNRLNGQPLTELGIAPEQVFPVPSVLARARRDVLALFPEQIVDSVYSLYFSGGRPRRSYRTLHEAVDIVVERVRTAGTPTYTYLYTPSVDAAAHAYGTAHPETRGAVLELDRAMERLAQQLAGRARLVVSADHGLLDAPKRGRHHLRPSPALMSSLRYPPSGEHRVLYFHLADNGLRWVRETFRKGLHDRFFLIPIEEAERLELFGPGPLSPLVRARLGDVIAIASGPDLMEYVPNNGGGRIAAEVADHSGLTPEEMRIPLVLA